MDFYNLDYIISHQSTDSALRVAIILAFLLVGIVFSTLYFRNRIRTRWRDVGIGALVLSLALVGIQAEQYLQVSNQISQSQLLVKFIEGVATDQQISADEVLVNATNLKDGIIVRFN